MKAAPLSAVLGLAVTILVGSTVFFHYVENWDWLDAWFFTVVTVSTVGYGNLVPVTVIGKIGTTVLIFMGIGVFALLVGQIGDRVVRQRLEHMEEKREKNHRSANRNL